MTVIPGDTVLMPSGTEIITEPLTPTDVQEVIAGGIPSPNAVSYTHLTLPTSDLV